MIHLLHVRGIFKFLIIVNIIFLLLLTYFIDPQATSFETLRYLTIVVTFVDILILFFTKYLWRWFWKRIPTLSGQIFPDINGIWEGEIIFYDNNQQSKGLNAKARIKQDLWQINIDLHSTTSQSHTLVAYPIIEAGNPKLYYIFHNTPNNPEYPEYKGTTILTVKSETNPIELVGQYYTIRGTKGRVELKRTGLNPKENL